MNNCTYDNYFIANLDPFNIVYHMNVHMAVVIIGDGAAKLFLLDLLFTYGFFYLRNKFKKFSSFFIGGIKCIRNIIQHFIFT